MCSRKPVFLARHSEPSASSGENCLRELPLGGLRSCIARMSEAAGTVDFSAAAFEMAEPRCDAYRALLSQEDVTIRRR